MNAVPDAVLTLAANVRLAIFDVDGVLTNGQLLLGPQGEELKQFHVRDGHGLVMLRESGVTLAVITGRKSPVVAARMAELGIHFVYQGQRDKLQAFDALLAELKLSPAEVCYVGDDLPDLPVMKRVALSVAVADAHWAIAEAAVWRTSLPGGQGAVREVCELVMRARGTLAAQLAHYGAVA